MSTLQKRLPLALVAILLGGCATYVPTALTDLPIGGPVRIRVSPDAYAKLPQISDLSGQQYAGTLLRRSDTELVLHIPIAPMSPLGQEVNIPVSGIVIGEVRRQSTPRTLLAVAIGVGVFGGAILASKHTGPQVEPIADNTDHDQAFTRVLARALMFSFPVP